MADSSWTGAGKQPAVVLSRAVSTSSKTHQACSAAACAARPPAHLGPAPSAQWRICSG